MLASIFCAGLGLGEVTDRSEELGMENTGGEHLPDTPTVQG